MLLLFFSFAFLPTIWSQPYIILNYFSPSFFPSTFILIIAYTNFVAFMPKASQSILSHPIHYQ